MGTKCLTPVKGRALRVTSLDGCGRVVYGEFSVGVSESFVSVALTANTVDTDEINVTNAAGNRCVFEPAETKLSGYSAEIQFCEVDPDVFSIITGYPAVLDADGDVVGFDVDTDATIEPKSFSLETWTGMATGDACSNPGAAGNFGYLLLPYLKGGYVGDFTVENNAVTFTITGATTRTGNAWGVGPYKVMLDGTGNPSTLLAPIKPTVPLRMMSTGVAYPSGVCGARPLLNPEATPITAITKVQTPASLSVKFTFTPNDSTEAVWIDFGDGTWDYGPGAAGFTHVYATAGTYNVKASSNGTWVSTTATVPGV